MTNIWHKNFSQSDLKKPLDRKAFPDAASARAAWKFGLVTAEKTLRNVENRDPTGFDGGEEVSFFKSQGEYLTWEQLSAGDEGRTRFIGEFMERHLRKLYPNLPMSWLSTRSEGSEEKLNEIDFEEGLGGDVQHLCAEDAEDPNTSANAKNVETQGTTQESVPMRWPKKKSFTALWNGKEIHIDKLISGLNQKFEYTSSSLSTDRLVRLAGASMCKDATKVSAEEARRSGRTITRNVSVAVVFKMQDKTTKKYSNRVFFGTSLVLQCAIRVSDRPA